MGPLGDLGPGNMFVVIGVHQDAKAHLMGVAETGSAQPLVLGLGQGRQQQGGENGDNGNDHKQLDESKGATPPRTRNFGILVDSALRSA
jgi:hypothetical protein